ncbi:beta-galactosidase [bacterium]|nr:beta-galactosidase [bacterium]
MHEFTYKNGRYYRDGKPLFVVAAEYHFHRDKRENWKDRLEKLKASGANTIDFYIPWRHHMLIQNDHRVYDFTGWTKDSRDVVTWMKTIESLGLYMIVKPGPFIHSELNIGGLPDVVSPTYSPGVPAQRRHHGKMAYWGYDASALPAPFDPDFDALCKEWLEEVRAVVRPFVREGGPVIGIQMNDETVYCTSNDPPWHIGYEASGMQYFHDLLRRRYGNIDHYNATHGTSYPGFDLIPAPKLAWTAEEAKAKGLIPKSEKDLLRYIDWAEYQWKMRRDLYVRYKDYLGFELPHLTNYAGITPPIVENVPDQQEHAKEAIPSDFQPLYPEWWFAMNRVDQDAKDGSYEYGMISWLGVAAYDMDVFNRYINTARRARGINMEENWGFATLYDHRSKDPIVPFYQTLASVAGGATGYVIFLGVSTDYWEDDLDRTTKKQYPTFPSHAPIDEHGNLRPMYDTMTMLNRWFRENGEALLSCELETDIAYLLYAPYAAVSSWIPDERYWGIKGHGIPRCGRQGLEEFSISLQEAGYTFGMFELESATDEELGGPKGVAIESSFFMDPASQRKLARFVKAGGRLFISGELPTHDLEMQPCTILKEAMNGAKNVVYQTSNMFEDGKFATIVAKAGIEPSVKHSGGMRAYVHRSENDAFVFFFSFDLKGSHDKEIQFEGGTIKLRLGSKTSGVLRITDGKLTEYMVKGINEVEGITDTIRIEFGGTVIEKTGDFSSLK